MLCLAELSSINQVKMITHISSKTVDLKTPVIEQRDKSTNNHMELDFVLKIMTHHFSHNKVINRSSFLQKRVQIVTFQAKMVLNHYFLVQNVYS